MIVLKLSFQISPFNTYYTIVIIAKIYFTRRWKYFWEIEWQIWFINSQIMPGNKKFNQIQTVLVLASKEGLPNLAKLLSLSVVNLRIFTKLLSTCSLTKVKACSLDVILGEDEWKVWEDECLERVDPIAVPAAMCLSKTINTSAMLLAIKPLKNSVTALVIKAQMKIC